MIKLDKAGVIKAINQKVFVDLIDQAIETSIYTGEEIVTVIPEEYVQDAQELYARSGWAVFTEDLERGPGKKQVRLRQCLVEHAETSEVKFTSEKYNAIVGCMPGEGFYQEIIRKMQEARVASIEVDEETLPHANVAGNLECVVRGYQRLAMKHVFESNGFIVALRNGSFIIELVM